MKSREKIIFLLSSVLLGFNGSLNAWEGHEEDPHYEWFDADSVAVLEDGIYTDSNKGPLRLNVVEHDRVNNRYKVLCSCLKRHGLGLEEALSIPYEEISE